jgi:hypothetical protein
VTNQAPQAARDSGTRRKGGGTEPAATIEEARRPVRGRRRVSLGLEILREYARVRWLMHSNDLPQVIALLRSLDPPRQGWTGEPELARVIGQRLGSAVIHTLSVLPTDRRCLVRSLVLTRLLASRGIDSTFVIGVNADSEFSAHAWVERNGTPLLPTEGYVSRRLVEL